jgi:hypothetical protein
LVFVGGLLDLAYNNYTRMPLLPLYSRSLLGIGYEILEGLFLDGVPPPPQTVVIMAAGVSEDQPFEREELGMQIALAPQPVDPARPVPHRGGFGGDQDPFARCDNQQGFPHKVTATARVSCIAMQSSQDRNGLWHKSELLGNCAVIFLLWQQLDGTRSHGINFMGPARICPAIILECYTTPYQCCHLMILS